MRKNLTVLLSRVLIQYHSALAPLAKAADQGSEHIPQCTLEEVVTGESNSQAANYYEVLCILKRFYVGSAENVPQNQQESESEEEEVTGEGC